MSELIESQQEFVLFLKNRGMYNPYASAEVMRAMHNVWKECQSTEAAELEKLQPVLKFDREALDSTFENVTRIEDGRFAVYTVADQYSNNAGTITCMKGSEIRIYVDNFPAQKKYFSCNYPIESLDDFKKDIARTGLILTPIGTQEDAALQPELKTVEDMGMIVLAERAKCNDNYDDLAEELCAQFPNQSRFQIFAHCYKKSLQPKLAQYLFDHQAP